jgi:hypothetical protein
MSFGDNIDKLTKDFVRHVESLETCTDAVVQSLIQARQLAQEGLIRFTDQYCTPEDESAAATGLDSDSKDSTNDKGSVYSTNVEHLHQLLALIRQVETFDRGIPLAPRGLLVAMVSQFDAFVGAVIRECFRQKPEVLLGSGREIRVREVLAHGSLEAFRDSLIEAEIESLLRQSHSDQLDTIGKRFSITIKPRKELLASFIELTQRRNLFVHCDGVVSAQYVKVCRNFNALDGEVMEGTRLRVSRSYFENAVNCLIELAIELSQVLWRKLDPESLEKADSSLNDLCVELIRWDRNEVAIPILDFACKDLLHHSSERSRYCLIVNRAQALIWAGRESEGRKIIESVDWSASSPLFQLAHAVLIEKWDAAAKLMNMAVKSELLSELSVHDWPLFKRFKQTEQFSREYKLAFGRDYVPRAKMPILEADPPHAGRQARPSAGKSKANTSPSKLRYRLKRDHRDRRHSATPAQSSEQDT